MSNLKKLSLVSYITFIVTFVIALISFVSVLFPAFLPESLSSFPNPNSNPYEFGFWAYPVLVSNIIFLVIGIAYRKNKLPQQVLSLINFVLNFEASRKITVIVIIVLIAFYTIFSIDELGREEYELGDYRDVKKAAENWTFNEFNISIGSHLKYFLLHTSFLIFDNIRILPFVASIALLILTYFITVKITEKRFAGIIAMIVLLQSNLFLLFDTTASYENFWILFYLLSLYLIYKMPSLSALSYILSVFSKHIVIVYLPMTFFFIYRSTISKRKKFFTALIYGVILSFIAISFATGNIPSISDDLVFDHKKFLLGFTSLANSLRFDGVVLIGLLPVMVLLFIKSRNGFPQADSFLVLMAGVLLSAPLLTGLTDITNQPYRFIPLVVFFAIAVGTLFSQKIR